MPGITQVWQASFGHHDELFQSLAQRITLVHFRRILERQEIIIRFDNGYGVKLLLAPLAGNEEVFEMLLLRFHGPKIRDHKLGQYAPVPELNWGNFEEIIDLCKQVSLLPPSQTSGEHGSNQGGDAAKKRSLDPRCFPPSPGRHGPGRCA
jgi:hypothetical protein